MLDANHITEGGLKKKSTSQSCGREIGVNSCREGRLRDEKSFMLYLYLYLYVYVYRIERVAVKPKSCLNFIVVVANGRCWSRFVVPL